MQKIFYLYTPLITEKKTAGSWETDEHGYCFIGTSEHELYNLFMDKLGKDFETIMNWAFGKNKWGNPKDGITISKKDLTDLIIRKAMKNADTEVVINKKHIETLTVDELLTIFQALWRIRFFAGVLGNSMILKKYATKSILHSTS